MPSDDVVRGPRTDRGHGDAPVLQGIRQRGEITPEFATTTSSSQENSTATSTSVGVEVEVGEKVEFEDPITKVTASSKVSAAVGYDRTGEHETTKALTITKSNGYGGSLDEDSVVVNLVRYLSYQGTVVQSSNGLVPLLCGHVVGVREGVDEAQRARRQRRDVEDGRRPAGR